MVTERADRSPPAPSPEPQGRILITGHEGLIGRGVRAALTRSGFETAGLDLRGAGAWRGDVRDPTTVRAALEGCAGIVHLAAVSRVVDGQRDPERCLSVNIGGLQNLLRAAFDATARPWILFASSREVYGDARILPVSEGAPVDPLNVYAETKCRGETLVRDARSSGLRAAIVRLSSVYGDPLDHADRVVPAFCIAALARRPLRVDGADRVLDLTHVSEVSRGLCAVVERLQAADPPPDLHLVSGAGTSLGALARAVSAAAGVPVFSEPGPERTYDVTRFVGDPTRARQELGWAHEVPLSDGLRGLLSELRARQRDQDDEGRALRLGQPISTAARPSAQQ